VARTKRKPTAAFKHRAASASEDRPAHVRELSNSFRATILGQFAQFAKAVAESHVLGDQQKTGLLYEALDELIKVIERVSRPAPEHAPELWTQRADKSEDVFEFIRRVYGSYLPKGLKKSDLFHLDPGLYQAIFDWKKKHRREPNFVLLTKRQDNDRLLAQLEGKLTSRVVFGGIPPKHRDYLRLYRTLSSRRYSKRKRERGTCN
jgi:hypothetical protein